MSRARDAAGMPRRLKMQCWTGTTGESDEKVGRALVWVYHHAILAGWASAVTTASRAGHTMQHNKFATFAVPECNDASPTVHDPFVAISRGRPINGRWSLASKIGEGGFGAVYLGFDVVSGEAVALKFEHPSDHRPTLQREAEMYRDLTGFEGFPQLYWFGEHSGYNVMALEMLGPSLAELFELCGYRFTLKTTLVILDQILCRLHDLHSAELVHRDIKPSNFSIGREPCEGEVYLLDFGISKHFDPRSDPPSPVVEEDSGGSARLVGTAKFASIRGHRGQAQSQRDDLESLGYMMVYFLKGTLPWLGLPMQDAREKEQAMLQIKAQITIPELCRDLDHEFASYFARVQSLQQGERPDYAGLRRMFRGLASRKAITYDFAYDWVDDDAETLHA